MIEKFNLPLQRKKYIPKIFKLKRYKAIKTANYNGGVTIFIKKRFLGFLWWIYKKDIFGNPITFNKEYEAKAFMNGIINYYEQLHSDRFDYKTWEGIEPRKKTHQDAYDQISLRIEQESGQKPELDCVIKSFDIEGGHYIHSATGIASTLHYIYLNTGKKLWEK